LALGNLIFLLSVLREALGKEIKFPFGKFFVDNKIKFFYLQILYRVPFQQALDKIFFLEILCRVLSQAALGKEIIFFWKLFAECPPRRHSTKK